MGCSGLMADLGLCSCLDCLLSAGLGLCYFGAVLIVGFCCPWPIRFYFKFGYYYIWLGFKLGLLFGGWAIW